MVRLDHFERVALRGERVDRALHQLPREALAAMRDHDAGAAVVGIFSIEAVEDEANEPLAVEGAGGEIGTIAAAPHEIRQVLDAVIRGDVVVAEGVIERFGHRFERDDGERPDVDHAPPIIAVNYLSARARFRQEIWRALCTAAMPSRRPRREKE